MANQTKALWQRSRLSPVFPVRGTNVFNNVNFSKFGYWSNTALQQKHVFSVLSQHVSLLRFNHVSTYKRQYYEAILEDIINRFKVDIKLQSYESYLIQGQACYLFSRYLLLFELKSMRQITNAGEYTITLIRLIKIVYFK